MLRNALNSLPAKPGFYGAVVLAMCVLVWYYASQYRDCARHRELKEQLYGGINTVKSGDAFRFADLSIFAWDRVHIRAGSGTRGETGNCPFEWSRSRAEHDAPAVAGQSAILVFTSEGQFVDRLEFRNSAIDFRDVVGVWTSDTAIFRLMHKSPLQVSLHPLEGNTRN